MPRTAQHQPDGAANLRQVGLEMIALSRVGHGPVALQRAVQIRRRPSGVADDDAIGDPGGVAGCRNQAVPHDFPHELDATEELDPRHELRSAPEFRGSHLLGRAAFQRYQGSNQVRATVRQSKRHGAPHGVGDDERVSEAERVEGGGDSVGLREEGIIRVSRSPGPARAERLDDGRLVSGLLEQRQQFPEAERGAEEAGDQNDGLASARGDHVERLTAGHGHAEASAAIGGDGGREQHPERHLSPWRGTSADR